MATEQTASKDEDLARRMSADIPGAMPVYRASSMRSDLSDAT